MKLVLLHIAYTNEEANGKQVIRIVHPLNP